MVEAGKPLHGVFELLPLGGGLVHLLQLLSSLEERPCIPLISESPLVGDLTQCRAPWRSHTLPVPALFEVLSMLPLHFRLVVWPILLLAPLLLAPF